MTAFSPKFSPAVASFLHARLSPEGYLGLHLTIGAILLLVATALFGAIAADVASAAPITLLDIRIARWLHAHATAALTTFMLGVTYLHGVTGITVLSVMLGIVFWRRHARYWALTLAIAVAGGAMLNVAMKYTFHRARPSFDDPLLTLLTYSFPSGHTAGSTLFYGVLASYLTAHHAGWAARGCIFLAALAMVLLVGTSRMYLGVHYFSDVLGAMAEGAAWLALTITAVSTLRRRRLWRQASIAGKTHV